MDCPRMCGNHLSTLRYCFWYQQGRFRTRWNIVSGCRLSKRNLPSVQVCFSYWSHLQEAAGRNSNRHSNWRLFPIHSGMSKLLILLECSDRGPRASHVRRSRWMWPRILLFLCSPIHSNPNAWHVVSSSRLCHALSNVWLRGRTRSTDMFIHESLDHLCQVQVLAGSLRCVYWCNDQQ